jgi:hypothetical protein
MQLHEFVDAVTADEPPLAHTADDIISAGRRAERRRRAGFATAGAAGLVAIAVAGAFALPSLGAKQSTTGAAKQSTTGAASAGTPTKDKTSAATAKWTDAPAFTFTFKGFRAGKLSVQDPIVASTAYQIASVYEDGRTTNDKPVSAADLKETLNAKEMRKPKPTIYAYLTVYRPGAFNAAGIKNGTTVSVAGHKAVQATLPVGLDPKNAVDPGNKLFAWEYTDNAWAVVTSVSNSAADPSFADFGALVTGLKPSTPTPARLPFTLGYVPAGYQPLQTGTHAMPGLDGIAAAREGDYGGATFASPAPAATGLTAPFDEGDGTVKNSFNIFVTPSNNSNQKAQAGKTKCYANGFCNVWSADGKVQVQISDEGTGANLSASEMSKIAHSITLADVNNDTTWAAASTALQP